MENPSTRQRLRARPVINLDYHITVDEDGIFHPRPKCSGGPFRSLVEATAAIRHKYFTMFPGVVRIHTYGETIQFHDLPDPPRFKPYSFTIESGMFNVHPPEVGGPFQNLSDAMAAVELHRTQPRIPPVPEEYFTIKDGLFHFHPYDLGGPFARLDDAFAALQMHRSSLKPHPLEDYLKDAAEKARKMQKWLIGELDAADLFSPITSKNPEPDDFPEEEEEIIRDGMMWMENDATKAFKAYLVSTETESMKGVKYEFHKLEYQCLIYDGPNKYHHYNFTMKIKLRLKRRWEHKSFFAEVKYVANGKQYFCCPLKDTDDGKLWLLNFFCGTACHCYGCRKVGIKLIHPETGGYEEGYEGAGFPFDTLEGA
ncbi:hypothetical protein PR202_gb22142 [Eleusine coracana subsp. coracana]|uniref:DUF3615 domain-containing protein n=1 Tax=Eleusine coracana subsp. coracana TaxID=191504 RepID=A0AAV5FFH7_ELECO|nr:hypothetical protein PR202_gb22142 [Eleusine coracana subsp. coracana]